MSSVSVSPLSWFSFSFLLFFFLNLKLCYLRCVILDNVGEIFHILSTYLTSLMSSAVCYLFGALFWSFSISCVKDTTVQMTKSFSQVFLEPFGGPSGEVRVERRICISSESQSLPACDLMVTSMSLESALYTPD